MRTNIRAVILFAALVTCLAVIGGLMPPGQVKVNGAVTVSGNVEYSPSPQGQIPDGTIVVADGAGGIRSTGCTFYKGGPSCATAATRTFPGTSCPIGSGNMYYNSRIDSLPVDTASAAEIAALNVGNNRIQPIPEMKINYATNSTPTAAVAIGGDTQIDGVDASNAYRLTASMQVSGFGLGVDTLATGLYRASGGWDAHVFVLNTDTCILQEYYNLDSIAPPYIFNFLAEFDMRDLRLRSATKMPGYGVSNYGLSSSDVAGEAIIPLVYTYDDLESGAPINHMGRIGILQSAVQPCYQWPATHYFPANPPPTAGPCMGAIMRLPANYDITTCHNGTSSRDGQAFPADIVRHLIGWQRYGVGITDYSGGGGHGGLSLDIDPRLGDGSSNTQLAHLAEWWHCVPLTAFQIVDNTSRIVRLDSGQVY